MEELALPAVEAHMALDDLLRVLAGVNAIRNQLDAVLVSVAAFVAEQAAFELEDPRGLTDPRRPLNVAAEEISMALGSTRRAAEKQIAVGRAVNGVLMETGDAMSAGRLGLDKAWVLVDALEGVSPEVAMAVESVVLPRAPQRTPTELRRDVARALIEVDPENADARHEAASARRHVGRPRMEANGMASMRLMLTAQAALALDAALDAVADAAVRARDPRTHAQLRADALSEWSREVLAEGWVPGICACEAGASCSTCDAVDAGGSELPRVAVPPTPAAIRVTVPLEVLAQAVPGWDAHPTLADEVSDEIRGGGTLSEEPHGRVEAAWLEGYGPIAPATARLLAAGGTWRRIVTDTMSGRPLDVGRHTYRPPAHIAEAVRIRDRVCQRPGCSAPASRCEEDHITEWQHGGHTSERNLALLCRRCHRIKSLGGGLESHLRPDGSRTWTSLAGVTHAMLPERSPRRMAASHSSAPGGA